ncbi:MAG TPA: PQQ-binding-like beta-propeller repeat protein [Candidatus Cybelea sp.]|jgi:outer membrane protein assembly factor BamB
MRTIPTVATTSLLFGVTLLSAGGCAPAGSGSGLPPQPGVVQSASSDNTTKSQAWPQYGYDSGHSGFNPLEKVIGAKNVSTLQIAWNNQNIIQPSGIVVAGSVAYVADQDQANGSVFALNANTGKQKWATDVGLNGSWGSFEAVPAVSGNVVLTPCSNNSPSNFKTGICGLNAKSGKLMWSQLCVAGYCGLTTSPGVTGSVAYYQFSDNYFTEYTQAVDPKTGHVLWQDAGTSDCKDAGPGGDLPLPAAGGYIFAAAACQGSQHNETDVCALATSSGTSVWCRDLQTQYITSLFEGGGTLYATASGGSTSKLVALNEKRGTVKWSKTLPNIASDAFAAADGRVFIDFHNATGLIAFSARNGKQLWTQTTGVTAAISVANGIVYTDAGGGNNGDHAITALNEKTGAIVWGSDAGNGASPATAVVLKGTIYAGCYTMCAFRLPAKHSRAI